MSTIKLYDNNAYLAEFTATVISCTKENGIYKTVLDKTAFFPEAGGQTADTGFIGDIPVTDVSIENEIIYHLTPAPLTVGKTVSCKIDFAKRYKKMQIHTGEHIVSGVMHNLLGLDNIGFHLGETEVTLDFNAVLTREQLDAAETAANRIIYKNVPVRCYYPSEIELERIDYRSKKELDGAIRIVEIEGHDICACCAPHVDHTGEVGIIKLTHFEKHKGGTRITMLCAEDALLDYREKFRNVSAVSAMLCAKPDLTAKAVELLLNEKNGLSRQITDLKRQVNTLKADAVEKSNQPLILFQKDMGIADMRAFANIVIKKRPAVYMFSPSKKGGFNYLCAGENMRAVLDKLSLAFAGGGGGSDKMIQGTVKAAAPEIKNFLSANLDK